MKRINNSFPDVVKGAKFHTKNKGLERDQFMIKNCVVEVLDVQDGIKGRWVTYKYIEGEFGEGVRQDTFARLLPEFLDNVHT